MRLTVFNGSPRAKKSNTDILLKNFIQGFEKEGNIAPINYLVQTQKTREFVGKFQNADNILITFPLYTDSMPGIVMEFIEALQDVKFYEENQRIGFLIHCGFPETTHLRAIEKYLEKLSKRLEIHYVGTIVKGGSEGIRLTPGKINQKLFNYLSFLGNYYADHRKFNPALIKKIAGNEKFPKYLVPIFKLLNKTELFNTYWNKQLKKNNAYQNRSDSPF